MMNHFYRDFEERFYAPREIIKQLRKQYLRFVEPLASFYAGVPVFDVGCGRGEWLELMAEAGFLPRGVDLDEGMLDACRERNLPAEQGEGVTALSHLPNASQALVTAFHVVEHIPFDSLQLLMSEAIRVLKPGGLLILETPNPENITVATRNFYLDPTHQKPLPQQLLAFLPEYYGFLRTKVLRLQESPDIVSNNSPTLTQVLESVSPDYAVIAQKAGPQGVVELLNQAFEENAGVSIRELSSRFDRSIESRFEQLATKAAEAASLAESMRAEARAATLKAEALEQQLLSMQTSRLWNLPRPLEGLRRLAAGDRAVVGQLGRKAKEAVKPIAGSIVSQAKTTLDNHPRLGQWIKSALRRHPTLYRRLHNLRVQHPRGIEERSDV